MKKILLTFLCLFLFSFNSFSGEEVINENITFKPFKCEQLKSEVIRTKSENSCLIIQKLENHYEVKSHEHSINTWNSPQLLKYINKNVPSKKFISPNEIYHCCELILSKNNVNLIGSNIIIDGGQSI